MSCNVFQIVIIIKSDREFFNIHWLVKKYSVGMGKFSVELI
jgi:hypothetical protein